jgi:drug/metabolite transporter (DMT)-like permease
MNSKVMRQKPPAFFTANTKGVILAVTGAFCAAVYFIPYKKIVASMDPDIFVLGLFLISFLINLVPFVVRSNAFKINKSTFWGALGFAVLAVLGNYFCGKSLLGISTPLTVVIIRTQVIAVMFAGLVFFKEKVRSYLWIGSFTAVLGIIISSYSSGGWQISRWASIIWAFLSMISFTLIHVLVKAIIKRAEPLSLNLLRMLFATIIIAFLPGRVESILSLNMNEWLLIAISALFGPILSRISYIYAMKYLPLSKFILITMLSPVFALILAMVFINDIPTIYEISGGIIIITGTCLPAASSIFKKVAVKQRHND